MDLEQSTAIRLCSSCSSRAGGGEGVGPDHVGSKGYYSYYAIWEVCG